MEKIYMEDNNKKKGKSGVLNASVILTFAVAIFAVFSLIMADISLSQKSSVSYAAPAELPSDFLFTKGNDITGTNLDGSKSFNVPMYFADNDDSNPVFCVEHAVDPGINDTYSVGDEITDYGLLYLLNNSYANGVNVTGLDPNNANTKYVETWITQTAIWQYLYEKDTTAANNTLTEEERSAIASVTKLIRYTGVPGETGIVYQGENLYTTYVRGLVDKAKNASNIVKLNVSKQDDTIFLSEDKQYYFSSAITVTGEPSSALNRYSVVLEGIDGAKAVKEDGSELEENITTPTPFYIRIPADKVTKEVQTVTITVNGVFDTLEGKYYTASTPNLQKVVSVKAGQKTISNGTEVEFYGGEDTGMSKVQTIYFIGLIVLLCGVGIVYANAKPVQVKQ